jgi:hypothetical protein
MFPWTWAALYAARVVAQLHDGAPENLSLPAGGPDGEPMPNPPPLDPPPGGPQPPGRPSCPEGPSENPGGPLEGSISLAAPCASHSTLCSWAMSDKVASFSSGGGASIDRHLHKSRLSSPHQRSARVLRAAHARSRPAAFWEYLHLSSGQRARHICTSPRVHCAHLMRFSFTRHLRQVKSELASAMYSLPYLPAS